MMDLEPSHREQIEGCLGRPLTEEDLRPVAALSELSPAQLQVVRTLMAQQLVLTAVYIRAIAPVSVGEATRFMDELDTEQRRR